MTSDLKPELNAGKIVYFGSEHNSESLIALGRSLMHSMRKKYRMELVIIGDKSESSMIDENVMIHRIRSAAADGGRLEWTSFEMVEHLSDCSLMIIDEPFTLAGEAAFALAANLKIPCIINGEGETESSRNAWKWGMASICDAVVCHSEQRRCELGRDTKARIEVLPKFRSRADIDDAAVQLSRLIYDLVCRGE